MNWNKIGQTKFLKLLYKELPDPETFELYSFLVNPSESRCYVSLICHEHIEDVSRKWIKIGYSQPSILFEISFTEVTDLHYGDLSPRSPRELGDLFTFGKLQFHCDHGLLQGVQPI